MFGKFGKVAIEYPNSSMESYLAFHLQQVMTMTPLLVDIFHMMLHIYIYIFDLRIYNIYIYTLMLYILVYVYIYIQYTPQT